MLELYLLTRCGALLIVSILVTVCAGIVFLVSGIDYAHDGKGEVNSRCFKYSAIILSIFGALAILTPSKKDALLIFGLGSTIDYIQNNKKAQELPDKCVEALDAWLDSLNNKEG